MASYGNTFNSKTEDALKANSIITTPKKENPIVPSYGSGYTPSSPIVTKPNNAGSFAFDDSLAQRAANKMAMVSKSFADTGPEIPSVDSKPKTPNVIIPNYGSGPDTGFVDVGGPAGAANLKTSTAVDKADKAKDTKEDKKEDAVKTFADTGPEIPDSIDPDKPDSGLDANSDLKQILDIVKGWSNGDVDDNVYEKALNNSIARFGLYNQAQQNTLQQKIAQDPSLRGSGLAYGMLSLMGREQGLSAGDMLGKLSVQNAENLINMQKFGIQNFQTLERESYARNKESINTLIDNGQYQSAARGLENLIKDSTGMNIVVDPIGLASRDPFTVDSLNNAWDLFDNMIDPDDPQSAIDYLENNILNNEAYAKLIPGLEGLSAEQIVQGRIDGSFATRNAENNVTYVDINQSINSGDSFDMVSDLYGGLKGMDETFRASGENFIMSEGGQYDLDSLEQLNDWRIESGLDPFEIIDGIMVDDNGTTLDEGDFQSIGQMRDYYSREADTTTSEALNLLKQDPRMADWLNDPQAMKEMGQFAYDLDIGRYSEIDPETGLALPPPGDAFDMMSNESYYHVFYDWPLAQFNADGTINGDTYSGGEMRNPSYEPQVDRNGNITADEARKIQEDEKLDKAYVSYRSKGGELNGQQWYYQSQGGKVPVGNEFDSEKYGTNVGELFKGTDPLQPPKDLPTGEKNWEDMSELEKLDYTSAFPGKSDADFANELATNPDKLVSAGIIQELNKEAQFSEEWINSLKLDGSHSNIKVGDKIYSVQHPDTPVNTIGSTDPISREALGGGGHQAVFLVSEGSTPVQMMISGPNKGKIITSSVSGHILAFTPEEWAANEPIMDKFSKVMKRLEGTNESHGLQFETFKELTKNLTDDEIFEAINRYNTKFKELPEIKDGAGDTFFRMIATNIFVNRGQKRA